jgi:hypothetical protein
MGSGPRLRRIRTWREEGLGFSAEPFDLVITTVDGRACMYSILLPSPSLRDVLSITDPSRSGTLDLRRQEGPPPPPERSPSDEGKDPAFGVLALRRPDPAGALLRRPRAKRPEPLRREDGQWEHWCRRVDSTIPYIRVVSEELDIYICSRPWTTAGSFHPSVEIVVSRLISIFIRWQLL